MKLMTIIAICSFILSTAYADHHDEQKKKTGHDKEHSHVEAGKVDHVHDDAHHKDHDHKAHHPDHKEEAKSVKKKK
jgi:hypothetical protein